eukprot:11202801-Lingulodinium_polyedra.AAC.1
MGRRSICLHQRVPGVGGAAEHWGMWVRRSSIIVPTGWALALWSVISGNPTSMAQSTTGIRPGATNPRHLEEN